MKSSSSYEFLLPKTQRINELTVEAVEGNKKEIFIFFLSFQLI
jgi:hypothetical protein